MKVCNYFELENTFKKNGIGTAVQNQRKALNKVGIKTTSNPKDDYDLLHTNTIGPKSLYHVKKCNLNGKKSILHAHTTAEDFRNSFKFSNKLAKPLKKYLEYFYDQGDSLLCPSKYTKNLLEKYDIKSNPIVVSNGINTEKFKPNKKLRKKTRQKLGIEGKVVFSVGSVFKRKGIKTFVEIARDFPETDFVWFGPKFDILQKRETKKIIKNSPSNVIFTGKIDNILKAYSAGDIFFFPTRNENQGLTVLEAASCGKPILIRNIPAFNYIEDGVACLKGHNKEEFKEHLKKLLNNKDLGDKLSKNAVKVSEKHSLEKIGQKLKQIYEEIMSTTPP